MLYLRHATIKTVFIGPFVDDTDGKTAETALTIANTDIRLGKAGANIVAKSTGGGTHDELGYYSIDLAVADTNTVGALQLMVHVSGALPVYHEFTVMEEAAFDVLFAGGAGADLNTAKIDTLQTDLDTITGSDGATLATAQALYAPAKAGDSMALSAGAITNASLAGNMEIVFETDFATNYNQTDNAWVTNGTSFVGTGWNTGKTGYSLTATTGLGNQTANITGNLSGSVGSVTGAVGSVTGAVGSVTGAVGSVAGNVDGNVTGSVGSNLELGPAEVNAEVDTALADYDPPTNTEMEARTLLAASYFDPAADTVATVTTVSNEVTADVTKISGSATAADNLEGSALGIITGVAQTGTLNTTTMTSDLTGYLDDELIGRTVVWTGGTAAGQASDITDYASASGTVTYTAITTAPANNDTFVIV